MEQTDLKLLQTVPAYHLQSMLRVRRVPVNPPHLSTGAALSTSASASLPPAVMQDIARHLFDTQSLTTVLQQLERGDAAILRELVACGGRANSRDLALFFSYNSELSGTGRKESSSTGEIPRTSLPNMPLMPLQPPQYPAPHPHGVFEQALRRLLVAGLVFWGRQTPLSGRDYTSGIHDGLLIVPLSVRLVVQQVWGEEPRLLNQAQGSWITNSMRQLQRDLYQYWSLVAMQREGLALINSGILARSALRQVVEHMRYSHEQQQIRMENDYPRLLFLRLLLQRLGLLVERGNALFAGPAEAFFALPLVERAIRCYQTYVKGNFWNELCYLPEVNVRPGPLILEPAHEEVVRSRQVVLERLCYEQGDFWHSFTCFIAHTKLHVPGLLFPRQYGSRTERYNSGNNPYGWDFRLRRGWLTHREGWHMVEGGFIRALIGGPLYWLGLVELDREESPTSFRLSPALLTVMETVDFPPEEEHEGRVIVQPNFEILVMAPVSEVQLVRLDRFAERMSLEHVAQYRLTKASVARALQRGLVVQDIITYLEHVSSSSLPQNVQYTLLEWERQARRVEIRPSETLLEVDDPVLLDALFGQEETRALFRARLSPYMAAIAPGAQYDVERVLWHNNLLPALTWVQNGDEEPSEHEFQWHLNEDGFLLPCYAVPNLYLVAEAERFCERDPESSWLRLTEAAVRQALKQNITLQQIVTFLQLNCDGGIPPSLFIQLKLWGGWYQDTSVVLERNPVLCLSSEVLNDLQNDQEVQSLLKSTIAPEKKVVRVDPEHIDRLLSLLRERGFDIE